MKTYLFVGEGQGVPGLPHVVTDAWAEEQGLADVLAECIHKRMYEEIKDEIKETAAPSKMMLRSKQKKESEE